MPSNDRPRAVRIRADWERELPGAPTRAIPLVTALKQVGAALRAARADALRDLGIDAATLDLLSTLRRAGPPYELTTRELTDRCLVTAGAVSQRVARAERGGLVARRPGDGRRVHVALTAAGHAVVERSARHVLEADDAVTGVLDDEAVTDLERLLTQWAARLSGTRP